jgi:hypothetical protein
LLSLLGSLSVKMVNSLESRVGLVKRDSEFIELLEFVGLIEFIEFREFVGLLEFVGVPGLFAPG